MALTLVHKDTVIERIQERLKTATDLELHRCLQQLSILDSRINIEEVRTGTISDDTMRAVEAIMLNGGRRERRRLKRRARARARKKA
jgi:hypothetical protein